MASYKIVFLIILITFFNFSITDAQDDDPIYLYQYCSGERTYANTSFQTDVKNLLSSLSKSSTDTEFYNTTFTGENPSDSIYGLFMCRGDVSPLVCQQCVQSAIQRLSSQCPLTKQAVIWYEECMVRYSNIYFFSTMTTTPAILPLFNRGKASSSKSFMNLLTSTMTKTANDTASSPIGHKKFATREENVSGGFQTLYCLAQCTQDLSPFDCGACLKKVIGQVSNSSEGRFGGKVLYPSCNIRYESYPFYILSSSTPPPVLVNLTNSSYTKLNFLEPPNYLYHNCSSNKTFTINSTFQIHLKNLFSYLSSNATSGNKFLKVVLNDIVYGLFMCRGDISSSICGQCIQNASHQITLKCNTFQEAIIWYNLCLFRYSYRNFFLKVETRPMFWKLNITTNYMAPNFWDVSLAKTLDRAAVEAGDSDMRFGIKNTKLNEFQNLYTLAQCTQDLSNDDCKGCLGKVIGTEIPWSRLERTGGIILYPSCSLRFELFPFYKGGEEAPQLLLPPPVYGAGKGFWGKIMLITVLSTAVLVFFFLAYYFLKRSASKSQTTILKENFGLQIGTLEPLNFNLATVEAATNNFSNENKIGKGGFGEVYKGILLDGRQIAVKRLSKSSKQGANEFKNEVLLIAKLQHRNLVEFIGFCLEEQEKILIYEYVPNKSLDYFLFDSQRQKLLSWFERYKIIGGIARGILYLHEHSRLKVIHRDLKPSNILLDENMLPKISDFGIARIVEIDQDQLNTSLIVGTFGYMSPEYAMFGHFSEKSDIFSFGVMILEIITGKKNMSSNESRHIADGLLSYVWKQWRAQTPLSTLDPNIRKNYVKAEVTKCIQIALLCVQQNPDSRPAMVTIVSYLSSHFIELPIPEEPAFFSRGRMGAKEISKKSSSCRSINEMPTSEFFPR